MKHQLAILAAALFLLSVAATAEAAPSAYSPADTNHDCIIQFGEYAHARSAVLDGSLTFKHYAQARAAVLEYPTHYSETFPDDYSCQ